MDCGTGDRVCVAVARARPQFVERMKYYSDRKEQAFVGRHRGNEALGAAFETGEVYAMLIGKVFCKCGRGSCR